VDGKSLPDAAKRDVIASRESDVAPGGLPRECRIARTAEYDVVYREGKRRSSREFTLFVRPNGLERSRFGWSIKKALGSAVRRNRIRRRLREILRTHRQEISPGWDIVIHPRGSAATADFSELARELLKLIPRAPANTP
jgi:ribonuclease P protein component